MASLEQYVDVIRDMFHNGKSYSEISLSLTTMGVQRGCSSRSVRRFCAEHNLRQRGHTSDDVLEMAVGRAITETGPTYGRKMMSGYLASKGVLAGERRVGRALGAVHPPYQESRQQGARNLNPVPYEAEYMGHKLHLDQNEKLAMFGVTHILAIDGLSKKIVSHITIPVKNNLRIYEEVYRSAVLQYGMWDQIRVDRGREFYLTLYMQEKLAPHRHNLLRQPYLQTQSTKNHIVERIWPEVNNRINYPIKEALVQLTDQEVINMADNITRFCTSNLACQLCQIGMERFVQAWNAHSIPGKGIPNQLSAGGCPARVGAELLPSATAAADQYEMDMGGESALTRVSHFGTDPFTSEDNRVRAEGHFVAQYPDLTDLYNSVVNHNYAPFQNALMYLIETTRRLS